MDCTTKLQEFDRQYQKHEKIIVGKDKYQTTKNKEYKSVVRLIHHHTLAAASTDPNLERTILVEPTLPISSDEDREGKEIL